MALSAKSKRWLGWSIAALVFAFVWSGGGYWHYVVVILVAVSVLVIAAERYTNKKSN